MLTSKFALPLIPGCFVTVKSSALGTGKLVSVGKGSAIVEWFVSVARHCEKPFLQEFPLDEVSRIGVSPQTRCYVSDADGTNWRMGRVRGAFHSGEEQTGVMCEVHIGGGGACYVPEERVYARCYASPADPMETLIHRVQETPFFYERRASFFATLIAQRAAAHGLTGLLSARVLLLPHQAQIVRRVLEDPVQRYLLADEVGLGKTIEAGVIIRQLRLDEPKTSILVVVPPALRAQWQRELEEKLCLKVDGRRLQLVTTEEVVDHADDADFGLVVMDEAHHIAAARRMQPALWERCLSLAHRAPRVLLLSATPALNHEEDFLAMLHLLEPASYRLDELGAFHRLVADRQPIGQFLLSFNPGLRRYPARHAIERLRELFPDDATIVAGADELEACRDADEWPQERVDELVGALRLRICETYRIHRRMLRTARSSAELPVEVLAPRAQEDGPRLVAEYDFDARQEAAYRAFTNWREAAAAALWTMDEAGRDIQTPLLAEVCAVLAQLSATWLDLLAAAVRCRLHATKIDEQECRAEEKCLGAAVAQTLRAAPLFRDEEAYLQSLLHVCEGTGYEDAIETLAGVLRQVQRNRPQKVVVFTSHSEAARQIALRIAGWPGVGIVRAHVQGDAGADVNLLAFGSTEGAQTLVCDRSGEEGLNFQFADLIVHFDLPWEPNRLEQRIGRLDRIGHAEAVRSRVFVGYDGSNEGEPSLHEAWFALLRDGFDLWNQSVADLQFYVDAKMPAIKRAALLEGAPGLRALLETLKAEIESERQSVREQAALDQIEAFERNDADFFPALQKCDAQALVFREAFEDWVVEALHFRRHAEAGVVRYSSTESTLVPLEWAEKLITAQNAATAIGGRSTFARSLACAEPPKQLLRLGAPMVDLLHRLLRWDDRGKAYAIWRATPDWTSPDEGFFFRFDYIIETDARSLRALLEEQGLTAGALAEAERALLRRADAWFPPRRVPLRLDSDSHIVTDKDEAGPLLKRPYEKASVHGRDYNLDAERLWALDAVLSPDRWPSLCRATRNKSEKLIRNAPGLLQLSRDGATKARHDMERHLEGAQRALLCRAQFVRGGDLVEAALQRERAQFEAVIAGILKPRLTLDSVGFTVLSNRNPFAGRE
ncbi:MAG TPA: protein DpdE [Abditibacteriaceae bacterium]|jgi:ATP-dependent helicase HepA